ncbi:hypothetical protein F0M18_12900 [Pseudohalioglobus sediminis]|uniref:Lipopolysaccharide biosynthesis protein n=1 Tax=Pseudohalioglobus sediminis TaxID=2606449 RepID=A0A5B0WU62_9GAMM|nr:hypothetical protein [Pseudohalioglobus sediminis]KAA1189967.1 hypothetical protein F0M18_12900 [Pseudohalioglobus sediminis]
MADEQLQIRPVSEYLDVVKRRKFWLLVPAIIIIPLALVIAFGLPASYQSQATILIQEQEVPRDFVRSTITSYAAQRVQVTSQRVLTSENIAKIIQKFQLYQYVEGDEAPDSRLVAKFRQNVQLDLVSAEVIDPRSGRPTQATIAFTLAFKSPRPEMAQAVTDELVTLFLNENARERTEQAASTADFLESEAGRMNAELLELEQLLADFKSANEGNLPELYNRNLVNLENARRDMVALQLRSSELEKRKFELASRMSQISPSAPVYTSTGDVVMSDVDRFKALQAEYRRKVALYRDNHPDLIRLKREIETLQSELGIGADADELRRQLREQQQRLADLETRYNDSHQEVVSTRRVIEQLEESIRLAGDANISSDGAVADNPAYILLQGELFSVESELRTLVGRQQELQRVIDEYEYKINSAPEVEKKYQALLRDYDNATEEYRDIKTKQREAIVAMNLEQEQKGEHFAVIEPPALPQDPVSPNRPAIIFLGMIVAIGLGGGLVVLREVTDSAIHGVRQLTLEMGEAPLVAIPYIENDIDIMNRRRTWTIAIVALAATVLVVSFTTYSFIQ